DNPGALAVIPQTGELAVVNSGTNDVSIVDPLTLHVSTVRAGLLPTGIAVNRVTGYAYVTNSWDNTVTAIYGYGEGKKRKTYLEMSCLLLDCRPCPRVRGASKADCTKLMEIEHLPKPTAGMPAARPPPMSRMAHSFSVGALIAISIGIPATAAQAQIPAHVRVMTTSERIWRWLGPQTDVLLIVDRGTTLEVIDFEKEKGWYWVVLPADLHGTRRVGWIRASSVEPDVALAGSHVPPPASTSQAQRDDAQAQALVAPSPSAAAAAEDTVAITVRRDAPAVS